MDLEFALRDMAQKVFTDDLLEFLLLEDQANVDQRDSFLQMEIYHQKKEDLAALLTPTQAADLEALEALHWDSLQALSVTAVLSGLYTSLQTVLTGQTDQGLFPASAAHDALDDPQVCPGYFQKRLEAEARFQRLRDALPAPARDLLVDVDLVWGDREYGVALQGFRLGLHGALRLLKHLHPELPNHRLDPLRREAQELSLA